MEEITGSRQEDRYGTRIWNPYGNWAAITDASSRICAKKKKNCAITVCFSILTWWLQQAWLSCEAQASPSSQWPAPKHVKCSELKPVLRIRIPDPVLLYTWTRIREAFFPDPGSRIPETNPYLWELGHNFLGWKYLNSLSIGSFNKVPIIFVQNKSPPPP